MHAQTRQWGGVSLGLCVPYLTVCVSMSILNYQEPDSVIGRTRAVQGDVWLCV